MKFFALIPLLALLSSLMIGSAQGTCTLPDMIVMSYPEAAVSDPAVNNFFLTVFDEDFDDTDGSSSRRLEPGNLRGGGGGGGGRNLCNIGWRNCVAPNPNSLQQRRWCNQLHNCGRRRHRRDLQEDEDNNNNNNNSHDDRNLQQVSGMPAAFNPQNYNCYDQGNTRFINAATNVTLDFDDDDEPELGRLYHCCFK